MNFEDLKILIVDDELGIRRSLSVFLEDEGVDVSTAVSGTEALSIDSLSKFNASIIDIRMPEMSGDLLIKKLHDINNNMKFIIYTGSQEFDIPPELKEIGISTDNVIYKPLNDLSALSSLLKKLCL